MKYRLSDAMGSYDYIEAKDMASVIEYVKRSPMGDYDTSKGTVWDSIVITPLDDDGEPCDESEQVLVTIHPPEPECYHNVHRWCSPYEVLGGDRCNPGVVGNKGGVIQTYVCENCGRYYSSNTWAQDLYTGQEGLFSESYRDADAKSLAWVLQRHLFDDFITLSSVEIRDRHDTAVFNVTGIDVSVNYDGLVYPRWSMASMDDVERTLDDIRSEMEYLSKKEN